MSDARQAAWKAHLGAEQMSTGDYWLEEYRAFCAGWDAASDALRAENAKLREALKAAEPMVFGRFGEPLTKHEVDRARGLTHAALASTEQAATEYTERLTLTVQTNEAVKWHQRTVIAGLHRDDCHATRYAVAPACECLETVVERIRSETIERVLAVIQDCESRRDCDTAIRALAQPCKLSCDSRRNNRECNCR